MSKQDLSLRVDIQCIYKDCPSVHDHSQLITHQSIFVRLVVVRGTNVAPSDVAEGDRGGRILLDNDRGVAGVSVAWSSLATKSQSVSNTSSLV